jgi:hypothetical protein
MRQSSVHHNSVNRKEKEKVMRKSFTAALVLVVALTFTVPASAAARSRDNEGPVTRVVRMVKKFFGIQTQADPTVPIPAPGTGGN